MALTTNINHLQPTGFQVIISKTHLPNATYFAQSVQHPGMQAGYAEVGRPRWNVAFPPDKLEFSLLNILFLVDEDLESYKEIDGWLRRIVCEPFVTADEAVGEGIEPSQRDITVNILTSHNNKNVSFVYRNCQPTTVGDMDLNAARSDGDFVTFPASFKFDYYEIL